MRRPLAPKQGPTNSAKVSKLSVSIPTSDRIRIQDICFILKQNISSMSSAPRLNIQVVCEFFGSSWQLLENKRWGITSRNSHRLKPIPIDVSGESLRQFVQTTRLFPSLQSPQLQLGRRKLRSAVLLGARHFACECQ